MVEQQDHECQEQHQREYVVPAARQPPGEAAESLDEKAVHAEPAQSEEHAQEQADEGPHLPVNRPCLCLPGTSAGFAGLGAPGGRPRRGGAAFVLLSSHGTLLCVLKKSGKGSALRVRRPSSNTQIRRSAPSWQRSAAGRWPHSRKPWPPERRPDTPGAAMCRCPPE